MNRMTRQLFAAVIGTASAGAVALALQQQDVRQTERQSKPTAVGAGSEVRSTSTTAQQVAPFVGENTFLVCHVDLEKVELKETHAWLRDTLAAIRTDPKGKQEQAGAIPQLQQLNQSLDLARQWVADMRQAGVQHVFTVTDPPQRRQPEQAQQKGEQPPANIPTPAGAVIVPIDKGDDVQAIQKLLMPKPDDNQLQLPQEIKTATIGNAIVLAPPQLIERFQKGQPGAGQPGAGQKGGDVKLRQIQAAFEATQQSAAQVIFIPTEQMKQFVGMLTQQLPQGVAQGDLPAMPEKVQWLAVAVDSPPKASVNVTIQADDAQAAQQISKSIEKLLADLRQNKAVQAEVTDVKTLTQALEPEVVGDRVVVGLEHQQLTQLLRQDIGRAASGAQGERTIKATEVPSDAGRSGQPNQQQKQQPQQQKESNSKPTPPSTPPPPGPVQPK